MTHGQPPRSPFGRFVLAAGLLAILALAWWGLSSLNRPAANQSSERTVAAGERSSEAQQPEPQLTPSAAAASSDAAPDAVAASQASADQGGSSQAAVDSVSESGRGGAGTATSVAASGASDPRAGRGASGGATLDDAGGAPSTPVAALLQSADLSDPAQRARVVAELSLREKRRMEAVLAKAASMGVPPRIRSADGRLSTLHDFSGNEPVYKSSMNVNAAISSGANVVRAAPYGLTGSTETLAVWDGGWVLDDHQELAGRIRLGDEDAEYDDHATHVAGTMIASGVRPAALGMAPAARIDSYDWFDDIAEMTAAGAATATETNKIGISNHSYGIVPSSSDMGRYSIYAQEVDAVAVALPYYLQFWAAGNAQRTLPGKKGYQSITHAQLGKNVLTVGAVNDAVTSGSRDPSKATMSSFSSWGPSDDGRIKPDLVANGVGLYSSVATSTNAYDTYSGTSMATPSASGTAGLLAQLWAREFPAASKMPASQLKALLVQTADDLGTPGPDYKFGWGLLNAKAAADLILAHKTKPTEPRFFNGQLTVDAPSTTLQFTWNGIDSIRATLCWTDPAGESQSETDSRVANLVHNLDLLITAPDGTTQHQPFTMPFVGQWTDASLQAAAVPGKNNTDNVEQVLIAPAAARVGTYTLTITLDGALTTPAQTYSLVVSGTGEPVNPPPSVSITSPQNGAVILPGTPVPVTIAAADLAEYGAPGQVQSVELLSNGTSLAVLTSAPYEFTWSPPAGNYTLQARALDIAGETGVSAPVSIEVRLPNLGEVIPNFDPPAANDFVQALAADAINGGRIYLGGQFTKLDDTNAMRVARLLVTGAIDPSFTPNYFPDATVRTMLYVPPPTAGAPSSSHHGLYVGGDFSQFLPTASGSNVSRPALARMAVGRSGVVDGTLDTAFNPRIEGASTNSPPRVRAIARQSDGKLLVGGSFAKVGGQARANLARLNPDGSLDASFAATPDGTVNAIALQPDGKILVGGSFSRVGTRSSPRVARLNPDGAVDTSFGVGADATGGFDGPVNAIAISPAGEILVGGQFTRYNGRAFYNNLAKLNATGLVDGKFNFTPGLNGVVENIHLRPTGAALVTGLFTQVGNNALGLASAERGRVLQFLDNTDADKDGLPDSPLSGLLDSAFNIGGSGANGSVLDSLQLPNGNILLAGAFTAFNGTPSARLAVIAGTDQEKPLVTSPSFHTVNLGEALLFEFTSTSPSAAYSVQGALPDGVAFQSGRLYGTPLQSGRFDLVVQATTIGGLSPASRFTLQVNPSPLPFSRWAQAWLGVASNPTQVLNPAGLSNLLVYALSGRDPRSAGRAILPVVARQTFNGGTYLTLKASKYAGTNGVNYIVEFSGDGGRTWRSDTAAVVMVSESPTEIIARAAVPTTASPRQLLRLKLVLAP